MAIHVTERASLSPSELFIADGRKGLESPSAELQPSMASELLKSGSVTLFEGLYDGRAELAVIWTFRVGLCQTLYCLHLLLIVSLKELSSM
jgi:hypothetical protein